MGRAALTCQLLEAFLGHQQPAAVVAERHQLPGRQPPPTRPAATAAASVARGAAGAPAGLALLRSGGKGLGAREALEQRQRAQRSDLRGFQVAGLVLRQQVEQAAAVLDGKRGGRAARGGTYSEGRWWETQCVCFPWPPSGSIMGLPQGPVAWTVEERYTLPGPHSPTLSLHASGRSTPAASAAESFRTSGPRNGGRPMRGRGPVTGPRRSAVANSGSSTGSPPAASMAVSQSHGGGRDSWGVQQLRGWCQPLRRVVRGLRLEGRSCSAKTSMHGAP
jgi:hypothetical protein